MYKANKSTYLIYGQNKSILALNCTRTVQSDIKKKNKQCQNLTVRRVSHGYSPPEQAGSSLYQWKL